MIVLLAAWVTLGDRCRGFGLEDFFMANFSDSPIETEPAILEFYVCIQKSVRVGVFSQGHIVHQRYGVTEKGHFNGFGKCFLWGELDDAAKHFSKT